MMNCQKDLFHIDAQLTYLNGAYMSPLLKSVEDAGILGLRKKRMPSNITIYDFFDAVDEVRNLFNQLINGIEDNRVVIMPSVSYGVANVANNLPKNNRRKIILVEDQFPSNYYIWDRVAKEKGLTLQIINRPDSLHSSWSERVLEAIDRETMLVSIAPLHWGDGTVFNLNAISQTVKQNDALLIIDGTQALGAFPYNQKEIDADVILAGSYKWLLGPYSIGLGYFGAAYDSGIPIEENWTNRVNSHDIQYLTNYQNKYRDGARRYEVGRLQIYKNPYAQCCSYPTP